MCACMFRRQFDCVCVCVCKCVYVCLCMCACIYFHSLILILFSILKRCKYYKFSFLSTYVILLVCVRVCLARWQTTSLEITRQLFWQLLYFGHDFNRSTSDMKSLTTIFTACPFHHTLVHCFKQQLDVPPITVRVYMCVYVCVLVRIFQSIVRTKLACKAVLDECVCSSCCRATQGALLKTAFSTFKRIQFIPFDLRVLILQFIQCNWQLINNAVADVHAFFALHILECDHPVN